MHFAFDDQQLMFRDAARALLADACSPAAVRGAWEGADGCVPWLWSQLAEQGFTGMLVAGQHGGLDLRLVDAVLVLEELGRAAAPGPFLETAIVAAPLLPDSWAERVAGGDAVLSTALGQDGVLAPHAGVADALLLAHGDELHLVPREQVERLAAESVDRTRRPARVSWTPSRETLLLSDALTIAAARDRGVLATSAMLVGLAARMIEMATEYAKVRRQFGAAIGSFQAVQHQLVDALLKVEFARPLVYRAAWELSEQTPDASRAASMAKVMASQAALHAARTALQVHGAIGYTTECDLHFWMKRAWALSAAWGDASVHIGQVRRSLLDRPESELERETSHG